MTQPRPAPRFAAPLALTLLAVAVVTVMAGSAIAQPARVVVTEEPTVVIVDDERVDGRFSDLDIDPSEIYTIEIDDDGGDRVMRIVTRAAAEAQGLPMEPRGLIRERVESGSGTVSFMVRDGEAAPDGEGTRLHLYEEIQTGPGTLSLRTRTADGLDLDALDGDPSVVRVYEEVRGLDSVRVSVAAPTGGVMIRRSTGAAPGLLFIDGESASEAALDALDPTDIASVEVLRGDAAIEAYGPAGADGVIRIVTKGASEAAARTESAEVEEAVEGFSVGAARPNPATEEVGVAVSLAEGQDVRFQVYDLSGRLVLQEDRSLTAGTSTVSFDVSGLAAGAYVVRATGTVDGQRVLARTRFTVAR